MILSLLHAHVQKYGETHVHEWLTTICPIAKAEAMGSLTKNSASSCDALCATPMSSFDSAFLNSSIQVPLFRSHGTRFGDSFPLRSE